MEGEGRAGEGFAELCSIMDKLPCAPSEIVVSANNQGSCLVGRPLYMDRATTRGERLAYARCFVEVAATQAMPCKIILENAERDLELLMLSTNGYPLVKHV